MPKLSFRVSGLDALIKVVGELEPKVIRPAVQRGVADATKAILWAARANLLANGSRRTGLLYKSLGRRVRVYRNSRTVVGLVGPRVDTVGTFTRTGRLVSGKVFSGRTAGKRTGKVKLSVPARYAHLVEFGTAPHATGKGSKRLAGGKRTRPGPQRGAMHPGAAPKPFLRPAYDLHKATALALVRRRVAEAVRKANARTR